MSRKAEYILLMLASGLVFALTFTFVLKTAQITGTDYNLHMESAERFRSLFPNHITYPLWHFLVFAVYVVGWYLLGNMPIIYAAAFVTSVVHVAIYVIMQRILAKRYALPCASLLAFALCVVMPIFIPWFSTSVYSGQISPVTWHSPTALIVKPFALLTFFLLVDICQDIRDSKPVSRKRWILLTVIVFVCMLAKPSFFQGIVPALGIYIIIYLIVTRFRKWKEYLFLCLCFVPAFCFMLLQFYFSFHTGAGRGVGFGWLDVFYAITTSPLISSLLGLVFPLGYILLNLRKCMRDTAIQLSLLHVACSWLEFAILYEKGPRFEHANFMWAPNLAYTILWVITTGMFFRDVWQMDLPGRRAVADQSDRGDCKAKKTLIKNTVIFAIWIIHLICGFYYLWDLLGRPGSWI